ncbi:MAG: class II aldolase [Clostridiales bacterium]|nr:class II aldolase [Clostridiales bacterium]
MNIQTIVKLSNKYGSDPELVLAGGGNTSIKDEETLFVKASGTELSDITGKGFVGMSRKGIEEIFHKKYPEDDKAREAAVLADLMAARLDPDGESRPSVETLLHGLFVHTLVLHLHPALINGLTCGSDGERAARRLFGDKALWIPACRPGYSLAMLCRNSMESYKKETGRDAQIMFLQNHGVFFAADTEKEIDSLLSYVLDTLKNAAVREPDLSQGIVDTEALRLSERIRGLAPGIKHVIYDGSIEAKRFSESREKALPLLAPLTPDHIVYCRAYPLFVGSEAELEDGFKRYLEKYGVLPRIIILRGTGFFAAGETGREADLARLLFLDAIKTAVYAESFGGVLHMSEKLTDFIVNWEAESYRQKKSI